MNWRRGWRLGKPNGRENAKCKAKIASEIMRGKPKPVAEEDPGDIIWE